MNKIRFILVKVGEKAKVINIDNDIRKIQKIVNGYIEMTYVSRTDQIAIIYNQKQEKKKLLPNRTIKFYNDKGKTIASNIINGNFLIAYAPFGSNDFETLPNDLLMKYFKIYQEPESFKLKQ